MMKKNLSRLCALTLFMAVCMQWVSAQNPYLPLWEFIPDGEPYLFEDPDKPGEYRVYIYGSHDMLKTEYCGRDQVVWSASVNDLTNWRYDGIIFKSERDANGNLLNEGGLADVLYAPDVALKTNSDGTKTYYLYPNNQAGGRQTMIAKSDRPDGPFEVCNWSKDNPRETTGILHFDPAAFVDDDGRAYAYWGFGESEAAELDPSTMCTLKPGTDIIKNMVAGYKQDEQFRFYEASSIRKIKDKYVFVYSRWTREGEFDLPGSNYTLAYAYSDHPLGPWTYGGTIIDGRARGKDMNGKTIPTASSTGNTHGSILEINGKWWVFYHRQTGSNEFSRQAMVAPIEVKVEEGKGGKVIISEGEYTSEGFATDGLNPFHRTPAGLACYLIGPKPDEVEFPNKRHFGSYLQPVYLDYDSYQGPSSQKVPFMPVVNNTDGSTVGYKYFNFNRLGQSQSVSMLIRLKPLGINGKIEILVGSPYKEKSGKCVGRVDIKSDMAQKMTELSVPLRGIYGMTGKQPVYFLFTSDTKERSICDFYDFMFK